MRIDAGELNERIEILRQTQVADADGYQQNTFEVVRSPWAKVTATSGHELIKAGAELQEAKVRFLIRQSRTEISRAMSVRWRGSIYPIEFTNEYDREYVEIWCRKTTLEG